MALDFPSNPTNGQTYNNYVWSSTDNVWRATNSAMTFPVQIANGGTGATTASAARTNLGLGKTVLQVVSASYSTAIANSTITYADTGLTATITPTSTTSKILVIVTQNGLHKTSGNGNNSIHLKLLRDTNDVQTFATSLGYDGVAVTRYLGGVATMYLDSPVTTSAVTYKTQFRNEVAAASVSVQYVSNTSTITLIEVAQ